MPSTFQLHVDACFAQLSINKDPELKNLIGADGTQNMNGSLLGLGTIVDFTNTGILKQPEVNKWIQKYNAANQ